MIRISLLLLVLVMMSPAADWPAFRGNMQRTGYCSDPVGLPEKKPRWTVKLGCGFVSSPAVVDNTLYIGGRDSCVYAIEAATGKVRWKKKTGGWVDSSPLLYDSKVFVGSRDGTIYAFDVKGEELLRMDAGLQLSSPAMTANGMVISGLGPPNNGFSVYPATNQGLGKNARATPTWTIGLDQMSYSSPSVFGQAAVMGASDGRFYMVNTDTRKIIWSLKTGGSVYLSSPAIDKEESQVFFAPGNSDRNVYSVDLLSGKVLWKSEGLAARGLDKQLQESPIPPETMVGLLRFKPESRQKIIAQKLKKTGRQSGLAKTLSNNASGWIPLGDMKTSSVAISPDMVYVIQKALGLQEKTVAGVMDQVYKPQFTLLALDKASGKEVWRFSELRGCVQLGYCSSPIVTDHSVFFGWGEGMVYSLDRKTGALQWSDTLSGDVISSPAIADGSLYVATMSGDLYSFKLLDTPPGLDFQRSTFCYPNPARGSVSNIQVYVERAGKLSMTLYNIAERPVFHVDENLQAGKKYIKEWNISGVANGVYFVRIKVVYAQGGVDKKTLKIAVLH